MTDLTEPLTEIRGVSQMLWVLSGFGATDLKSMPDAMYTMSRNLEHAIKIIEEKTSN